MVVFHKCAFRNVLGSIRSTRFYEEDFRGIIVGEKVFYMLQKRFLLWVIMDNRDIWKYTAFLLII